VFIDCPQLNGRVWEGRRHRALQRAQPLLEVRLGLRVGLHMARAWHPQTCPEAPQVDPAELATDVSSEPLANPGGNCPPALPIALRR
jgi:hypothetical protein